MSAEEPSGRVNRAAAEALATWARKVPTRMKAAAAEAGRQVAKSPVGRARNCPVCHIWRCPVHDEDPIYRDLP